MKVDPRSLRSRLHRILPLPGMDPLPVRRSCGCVGTRGRHQAGCPWIGRRKVASPKEPCPCMASGSKVGAYGWPSKKPDYPNRWGTRCRTFGARRARRPPPGATEGATTSCAMTALPSAARRRKHEAQERAQKRTVLACAGNPLLRVPPFEAPLPRAKGFFLHLLGLSLSPSEGERVVRPTPSYGRACLGASSRGDFGGHGGIL